MPGDLMDRLETFWTKTEEESWSWTVRFMDARGELVESQTIVARIFRRLAVRSLFVEQ